ncbi:MAG: LemA family protein, partial [Actinomycetota bacterium]
RNYNERVQQFPSMIIARMFGFEQEEFFEVDDALREAGPPRVDFTGSAPAANVEQTSQPPAPTPPPPPESSS